MQPLIAGNWKMHGTAPQLSDIADIVSVVRMTHPAADILICPPATLIARAVAAAEGQIAIGGQNCASEVSGSFTGDLSAEMLKDAGATWVILGHSERRQHHGETNSMVAAKAQAAWRAGLLTIICIGETGAQRRAGHAFAVCADQLRDSVPEILPATENAIAYEPLWAIGTGHIPALKAIAQVHSHIRQCLVARFGARGGQVRILYGGSVNPTNARAVLGVCAAESKRSDHENSDLSRWRRVDDRTTGRGSSTPKNTGFTTAILLPRRLLAWIMHEGTGFQGHAYKFGDVEA